jgi:hypothetical protein
MTTTTHIEGLVAPGFEEVRTEFERNFVERGEIGAAVAAYWRGEPGSHDDDADFHQIAAVSSAA